MDDQLCRHTALHYVTEDRKIFCAECDALLEVLGGDIQDLWRLSA